VASQIGVMLLNHGCPLESKGFEVGIRESEALYHSVREELVTRYPLVSIGWMNHPTPGKWTTPDMEQAAENLLTLGAKAIAFAPIGFVTENHETQLDVEYVIEELGDRAETIHVDCLNGDPEFLDCAAAWITPLIDDLLGESDPQRPADSA
jgi:ferrochelatase